MNTTNETVKLVGGVIVIACLMLVAQYLSSHLWGVNPFYLN